MDRKKIVIAIFLSIIVVVFLIKKFHVTAKQTETVVAVSSARIASITPHVHLIGTIVSSNGINISAERNGKVQQIFLQSGQSVKKGDLLLSLENDEYKSKLNQSIAKLRLARSDYDRYSILLKKQGVSPAEYDKVASQLASAQAEVEYQTSQHNQTLIRAPFDGRAGILKVNSGQYITSGQALVSLQALSPLYVDFSVPELYLPHLGAGSIIQLKIDTPQTILVNGKVTALGSAVDVETRTLSVRAVLEEVTHFTLYPGMSVEVKLILSKPNNEIIVPQTAIAYGPIGEYVFKVNKNHVQQIKVTTGEAVNDDIVVLQGLHQGDQVVCAGQIKLRPGAFVKTVPYKIREVVS